MNETAIMHWDHGTETVNQHHAYAEWHEKEGKKSDPEGIRTPDPQIRNLLLYPAELRDLYKLQSPKSDFPWKFRF